MFQPIVSLSDGQVVAYEALSRPQDGDGRPLSILEVVDSARSSGPAAEAELDALAIQAICGRAAELPHGVMLFVNVSPATLLQDPGVLDPLASISRNVVVEVTERTALSQGMESEFHRALDILRWRGFLVALDDCGAGYSGLTRLVAIRPDFAKVDMELVRGVDHDSAKAQLVEAVVSFARRAGISVIAEGVETEAELRTLGELDVRHVQGYYLGRPSAEVLPAGHRAVVPTPHRVPLADEATALGASIRLARMAARGLGDAVGLYEAIVHGAREATGADVAILRRRVDQGLVAVAVSGIADPSPAVQLSDDHPAAAAFNAGHAVVRQTRPVARPEAAYGSTIAASISVNGVGWGSLILGFYDENRVRGELVDVSTAFADLAGLILAANRSGPIGSRTDIIDALRYAVSHPDDLSDFLARVIREVEHATGSHDSWIGVVQGDQFDIVMGDGETQPTELGQWLDPENEMGKMPPGVSLRENRRVVVDDIRLEPSLQPQLDDLLAQAIISAAALPIRHEDRVLGVLKVYHSTVAAFTQEQLTFLEEVAGLLGAFLGNILGIV